MNDEAKQRIDAARAAAEKAAKERQNTIMLGNAFLFLAYVFLAATLESYHILTNWAAVTLVVFCTAAHILIAQRAWEG